MHPTTAAVDRQIDTFTCREMMMEDLIRSCTSFIIHLQRGLFLSLTLSLCRRDG